MGLLALEKVFRSLLSFVHFIISLHKKELFEPLQSTNMLHILSQKMGRQIVRNVSKFCFLKVCTSKSH